MKYVIYRGKSVADDKWYEGYYVVVEDYLSGEEQPVIIPIGTALYSHGEVSIIEFVDPITIGQFVGAYDMDGKKIFEGDIVQIERYGQVLNLVIRDIRTFDSLIRFPETCKVVGNIYDTPELI